ncbi:hypothetical protein [Enterobacter sp. UPMP2052]
MYLQFNIGDIQKGLITTQTETVMALSGQAVKDKEDKRYWPEGSSRRLLAKSDLQLLNKIDNPKQDWYYLEQYRRAVQNRSMRDHLYSLCVPPTASSTTPNKITAHKEPLFLLIAIDGMKRGNSDLQLKHNNLIIKFFC